MDMKHNLILTGLSLAGSAAAFLYLKYYPQEEEKEREKNNTLYPLLLFPLLAGLVLFRFCFYGITDMMTILRNVLLVTLLWVAAQTDFRYYRIPNRLLLYGFFGWLAITLGEFALQREYRFARLAGGLLIAGILILTIFVCLLFLKNSIGMGDLKLLALFGMITGPERVIEPLFFALFLNFVAAVFLLATGKKSRKDKLPFAPFLLWGTVAAYIMTGA